MSASVSAMNNDHSPESGDSSSDSFFRRIINNIRKLCCCNDTQHSGPTHEIRQPRTTTTNYERFWDEQVSRPVVPSHPVREDEVNARRSQNERRLQIASTSTVIQGNTHKTRELRKLEKHEELPSVYRNTLTKATKREELPSAHRIFDTSENASASAFGETHLEYAFPQSRNQHLQKFVREISDIKDTQNSRQENQIQQPKTTTNYERFRNEQPYLLDVPPYVVREDEVNARCFQNERKSQIASSSQISENNTNEDRPLKAICSKIVPCSFSVHSAVSPFDTGFTSGLDETDSKSSIPQLAEYYREQAKDHLERRKILNNKARQLSRLGNRRLADYFYQQAKEQTRLLEQANSSAAAAILAENQKRNTSGNIIDLHHLFVKEAIQALDSFLDDKINSLQNSDVDSKRLTVITGRGNHSVNSIPKIKPAVVKRLEKRCLEYKMNPGSLKVYIYKDSLKSNNITSS